MDGAAITNDEFRYDYEKYVTLSELPYISPHCLRHSFATNMWELEEDLKAISEMLGHSSIQVTADIYTKMSMDK
jgi:integrase